jgi:hypothetical protein
MEIHNNKHQISTGAAIAFSFGGIIIVAILVAGALAWRSVDLFENTINDLVEDGVIQIQINDVNGQIEVNESI